MVMRRKPTSRRRSLLHSCLVVIVFVPSSFAFSSCTKIRLQRQYELKRNNDSSSFFLQSTEEWLQRYLSLSLIEQRTFYSRFPNGVEGIHKLGRRRLHAWFAYFLGSSSSDYGVGFNHAQLKKMVLSRPQLLTYALSNIISTTQFFRIELGLSSIEYQQLLHSYPSVLMHSISTRLRPTVYFLQNECGGGRDNWTSWRKVVYMYPKVFSYSMERTLLPKLNFLCGDYTSNRGGEGSNVMNDNNSQHCCLQLSRSELSQVVSKFPPTLWLSNDNLQCKLDYLCESLGLATNGYDDLRSIIVSYPQILGLSLEYNLRPKMDFFIDCGLSQDQLREFVFYQPSLLAYSLENRLRPRIERMQEKNINL